MRALMHGRASGLVLLWIGLHAVLADHGGMVPTPPSSLVRATALSARLLFVLAVAPPFRISYRGFSSGLQNCTLPFTYNGITYDDCTTVEKGVEWFVQSCTHCGAFGYPPARMLDDIAAQRAAPATPRGFFTDF
jgi:hypothetical protein